MYMLMYYQIALLTECFITHRTGLRVITTMYVLMFYQSAPLTKCLITHISSVRIFTTMYALMCYQMTLLTECFITHSIYKSDHHYVCIHVLSDGYSFWMPYYIMRSYTIITMYALIWYQSALFNKSFTTFCTAVWAITTYVCVDVLSEFSFYWIPYCIMHSCKEDHQYVYVDVLSECSYAWMLYYILHSYKSDHHYGCADEYSKCFYAWMLYYILHNYKGEHQHV